MGPERLDNSEANFKKLGDLENQSINLKKHETKHNQESTEKPIKCWCCLYVETSQLICTEN